MSQISLDKDSEKDVKKELRETQQEVMMDLALKTNDFLEKFKAEDKKNQVQMQYEMILTNQRDSKEITKQVHHSSLNQIQSIQNP